MATLNNTVQNTSATSNHLSAENGEFYNKALLKRLIPELKFAKYASKPMVGGIPRKSGDTVSFRRVNSLALNKTPLVEGVTPEGQNLTVTKITATVAQYGGYVVLTDLLDMVGLDPMITEAAEVLGEQAGQSTESIIGDIIFAGTTVHRAGGVAARNLIATTISVADILTAKAMLQKANVRPLANGDYIMFVTIDQAQDIMQLTEWKTANTYRHDGLVTGAIGRLYGVQFIEMSEAFVTKYAAAGASSADVYAGLMMGQDYFGIIDIEGSAKPKILVKDARSGGTADPLEQRSTVGWKNLFTVKRINEACAVRVETL